MSAISEILSYWKTNATLQASQLPYTKVYFGITPEGLDFPYAVLLSVTTDSMYTTCTSYTEESLIQIDIYDQSLANVESLASTIDNQLNGQHLAASTMHFLRTNYMVYAEKDNKLPTKSVYHAILEYSFLRNRTIGV